ncbi:MAG: hypothetical protein GKR99_08350 [Rhodobacteraceae bacterium]|nr:hypothetical protein [Paracoccaceae bacterium]
MTLFEISQVPLAALPIAQLRDHLRLGTGFGDDAEQDGVMEAALRAALAAVEARTGKAVFQRQFHWSLLGWRHAGRQVIPVAPVAGIVSLTVKDIAGLATVIDADRYRVEIDDHAPSLVANGLLLPAIPIGGRAEVVFDAGLAADWAGQPGDLAQAVLMLAADFYEHRTEDAGRGMPAQVAALIEPHRHVRLFGQAL